MQLACDKVSPAALRLYRQYSHHLNDDKFSSASHLAGFGLPDACGCSVHSSAQSSDDTTDHYLGNAIARRLDDGANGNNRASDDDLPRSAKDVARPDGRQGSNEAAKIIYRSHCALKIGRRMTRRVEKVFADDDIAKDALGCVSA